MSRYNDRRSTRDRSRSPRRESSSSSSDILAKIDKLINDNCPEDSGYLKQRYISSSKRVVLAYPQWKLLKDLWDEKRKEEKKQEEEKKQAEQDKKMQFMFQNMANLLDNKLDNKLITLLNHNNNNNNNNNYNSSKPKKKATRKKKVVVESESEDESEDESEEEEDEEPKKRGRSTTPKRTNPSTKATPRKEVPKPKSRSNSVNPKQMPTKQTDEAVSEEDWASMLREEIGNTRLKKDWQDQLRAFLKENQKEDLYTDDIEELSKTEAIKKLSALLGNSE